LDTISTFQYTTTAPRHEGWGITYDESNKEFIVSDGSPHLYFWDRDSLEEKRKVTVSRFDGSTQNMLNELEFMDGLVCCNIWHQDEIICIDPTTGKSIREYGEFACKRSYPSIRALLTFLSITSKISDMSQLWPRSERGSSENVLNGIALGKDHVLVTGKRWDRMYKITLDDWPTLFLSKQVNSAESTNDYTEPTEEENIHSDTGKENVDTEQATVDVVSNGDAFKSLSEEVEDETADNKKSADVEIEHIESANEQVEELQEELDEMADDEEDTQDIANQQEDTTEQDNGDIMMEDNESEKSDMNYSVGASNTISSDWSIVEQVDHDNTSFT
jgi:hypothetical protein